MAPVSFAHPKTSAHVRPMICSKGVPIMAAKELLARTIRESSDCTQMPSSIASKSASQEREGASTPVCEPGSAGSDDSSFIVFFYRAYQPPSLRVSSIRFMLSNCLASDTRWDQWPIKHNEIV